MIDIVGQTFGNLFVEKEIEPWILPDGRKQRRMQCLCSCGNRCTPRFSDLRSGKATSCGCKRNKANHDRMFEDLSNKRFGRLFVLYRDKDKIKNNGEKRVNWVCQCDCGNIISITADSLKSGNTKSCGCYKSDSTHKRCFIDLSGQKFVHLFVEGFDHKEGKRTYYKCRCDCGTVCVVSRSHLISGHTTSCGHVRSRMEDIVNKYLMDNNYSYVYRQTFPDLTHYYNLEVDFAIYNKNNLVAIIECQGRQHYDDVGSFGRLQRETTDKIKQEYCKERNIPLFEIRYDENPIEKLKLILNELHVNPVPSSKE